MVQVSAERRSLVGMLTLALVAFELGGCSDQVGSNDWTFDPGTGGDRDAASPTGGDETSSDTGTRGDLSERDDTSDTSDVAETSGSTTEVTGWYVRGFEQSEFIPRDRGTVRGIFDRGDCQIRFRNQGQRWWAHWPGRSEAAKLLGFPPGSDGSIPTDGLFEARGDLSPEGEYGHLGSYDRKLDIHEANLDVCGSVSQLGHCVVPEPSQSNCVVADRTTAGRSGSIFELSFRKREFVKRLSGTGAYTSYILKLTQPVDHGTSIRLQFMPPSSDPGPYFTLSEITTDDRPPPILELRHLTFAEEYEYRYHKLEGWVAGPTGDSSVYQVSISATNPEGPSDGREVPDRLHVWGSYKVDRIEGTP